MINVFLYFTRGIIFDYNQAARDGIVDLFNRIINKLD